MPLRAIKIIIHVKKLGISFKIKTEKIAAKIGAAAIKTNVPLIIHSREAEDETFNILNDYKDQNLKILMHCFTGSKKFAKKLLDFNTFFSASGIITFKNAKELQDTFKF